MGIRDDVDEAVRDTERQFADDESFRELRDFYAEMQRRGLVVKRKYDLPLLDTIGRYAYRLAKGK